MRVQTTPSLDTESTNSKSYRQSLISKSEKQSHIEEAASSDASSLSISLDTTIHEGFS